MPICRPLCSFLHLCLLKVSPFGSEYLINDSLLPRQKYNLVWISNRSPSAASRNLSCVTFTTKTEEWLPIKRASRRHPPNYWSGLHKIRAELVMFWENTLQIPVLAEEKDTPPIPNEVLLSFANRYDLKYAINSVYSGREALAFALAVDSNSNTPSRIIGGRWYSDDCLNTREVQLLYRHAVLGPKLQKYKPYRPAATQLSHSVNSLDVFDISNTATATDISTGWKAFSGKRDKWRHRTARNSWGFWNASTVESELFTFLYSYNVKRNRPRVWAPRLSEFTNSNRADLHMALVRFYSTYDNICNIHRLIPYNEWSYFESVYQLLSQLHSYYYPETDKITTNDVVVDQQTSSDNYLVDNRKLIFPQVSKLRKTHPMLYQLIQRHGGQRNVAKRFGIALSNKCKMLDYDYGPFSLTFGLFLMSFIRNKMMNMEPLTSNSNVSTASPYEVEIRIPNQQELLHNAGDEGKIIHEQILKYGGYENVARRLGLIWG